MRGCQADVLEALLQGKQRVVLVTEYIYTFDNISFVKIVIDSNIIVTFTGKQQLLVDEDSRLAAASVVGIGNPPPFPPLPPFSYSPASPSSLLPPPLPPQLPSPLPR